jgi:hypothetical protein
MRTGGSNTTGLSISSCDSSDLTCQTLADVIATGTLSLLIGALRKG